MALYQNQNREEIRQAIGYNIGGVVVGEVTATGTAYTLIDKFQLAIGGDNEYKGRQVMINTPVGSIAAEEKSFVSGSNSNSFTLSLSPYFSAAVTDGDTYEMWQGYRIEEINNYINQAITKASDRFIKDKITTDTFTMQDEYEYDCLDGFVCLRSVEYVSHIEEKTTLHTCDTAWDELVDGDTTLTVDTTYNKEGSGCNKMVIAAGMSAGDIIATDDITSKDISDLDEIEIVIRSTVALAAGDVCLLLDNTASCASPVETINIPATAANTTTHHVITLANPELDTAIISVGLEMNVDKGALTLYVDDIVALKSASRIYKEIPPEQWSVVKKSTPLLRLTQRGYVTTGYNTLIRINGYQLPTIFPDDDTDADLPPEYIISAVSGDILMNHYKGRNTDTKARLERAGRYIGEAERMKIDKGSDLSGEVRWL